MYFRFDCQIQIYFIKVIGINDNIDNLKAISREKSRTKFYFKYNIILNFYYTSVTPKFMMQKLIRFDEVTDLWNTMKDRQRMCLSAFECGSATVISP